MMIHTEDLLPLLGFPLCELQHSHAMSVWLTSLSSWFSRLLTLKMMAIADLTTDNPYSFGIRPTQGSMTSLWLPIFNTSFLKMAEDPCSPPWTVSSAAAIFSYSSLQAVSKTSVPISILVSSECRVYSCTAIASLLWSCVRCCVHFLGRSKR